MKFDSQKYTVLGGELHLYRRRNSPFWWCGFHYKGKYIRKSTKCKNKTDANEYAKEWFYQRQAEIRTGKLIVSKGKTFGDIAKIAQKSFEGKVARGEKSVEYLKGFKRNLKGRVNPYFEKLYLSDINSATWYAFKKHVLENVNSNLSEKTFHQFKNTVRLVLIEALNLGLIDELPVFKDSYKSNKQTKPRAWFEPDEYKTLYTATRKSIKKLEKTRWKNAAKELHDYVIFMANTGLRIGEAKNVRFCDVEILSDKNFTNNHGAAKQYLLIRNIKGKRGTGECRSHWGARKPYMRIIERRKITHPKKSTKLVFQEHHRDMFNRILKETGLKETNSQPPARRDFLSLRHTYISFRLLDGANIYDVAANCRTSVKMIEQHYAQWLRPRMNSNINININRSGFGDEDAQ